MAKPRSFIGLAVTSFAVVAAAAALESALRKSLSRPSLDGPPGTSAARGLDRAGALLAAAALADSATEHYRGSFHNPIMALPLGVAAQTLGASLHGAADRQQPSVTRDFSHALALITGIAGTGFHCYNVLKRPGGWSWLNLFYAAPLGAPAALSLSGMLGGLAERLRRGGTTICGTRTGLLIARLVTLGLVGTTGEAALMHFRGAYHNPAMIVPVTVPPVAAGLLAAASLAPCWISPARWSMRLLTAIGLIGAGFHAYGIQRNMGGWRNWSQNLLNGPPLPAPPAFTALALAGLAALKLIERQR
ncbi:MAG: hypothetical protein ACREE2_03365 [Stellaceae bacterium]